MSAHTRTYCAINAGWCPFVFEIKTAKRQTNTNTNRQRDNKQADVERALSKDYSTSSHRASTSKGVAWHELDRALASVIVGVVIKIADCKYVRGPSCV